MVLDKLLRSSVLLIADLAVKYPDTSLEKLDERQRWIKVLVAIRYKKVMKV